MDLPTSLRSLIDKKMHGIASSTLKKKASLLSQRYREEMRDDTWHIVDHETALAYIVARLPATYAALCHAMSAVEYGLPDFSPKTLLDIGSGPGTSLWAAHTIWSNLQSATALEACAPIRDIGEEFSQHLPFPVLWENTNIIKSLPASDNKYNLVTISYVLDELEESQRQNLISQLWQKTNGLLLIVEPGTTNGWQRILTARQNLIDAGAHIIAPCPHSVACPVHMPDWCHFSARLARSKIHLQVKEADVPWEDEKFIYIAASRTKGLFCQNRVLSSPIVHKNRVSLKLCSHTGIKQERLVTKKEGITYKNARRANWGDGFDSNYALET